MSPIQHVLADRSISASQLHGILRLRYRPGNVQYIFGRFYAHHPLPAHSASLYRHQAKACPFGQYLNV